MSYQEFKGPWSVKLRGSSHIILKSKKATMDSPGDYMLKYTIPDLVITFRKFLEELWKNSEKSTL